MSTANQAAYQTNRLHEKLAAILKISQQMNSERDLGALLDLVAREATRLLEADRASIFLLDRDNMELWSKVALGSGEIIRFDARKGIAGVAALTGKVVNVRDAYSDDRVARALHYSSPRSRRPFVALNCAALPESLIESELFGIERGVATGVTPRVGQFQAADGGTLFLDEIGDLSLTAQAKILRAL